MMSVKKSLDRDTVKHTLPAVVQIVALRQGFMGNLSSAWTGSGTIIHPEGIILTNCHVANPRAMGMPAPPSDKLAIAITEKSDEPPILSYFAEIMVQSPKMDLALLRITKSIDGKRVKKANLPYVAVGDSDLLELGDALSIFGYPGIGGDTVTFTSGNVSGFTQQKDLTSGRAWIKTDATIAGGNSGGTAVDQKGQLVGIPTQAAAGTGISPVDARPVVDTNRDGRIDQRDTPMAVGGFINGLRPVNMAKPLFKKAGVSMASQTRSGRTAAISAPRAKSSKTTRKAKPKKPSSTTKTPLIKNLVFSDKVTADGRPVNPSAILTGDRKQLFASFEFDNLRTGTEWEQVWAANGKPVLREKGKWQDGPRGRKTIALASKKTIPNGQYHLVITYKGQILSEGQVVVGRRDDDTDTEISGQVIDRDTKRGVSDALVIAIKPNVKVAEFVRKKSKAMAFTSSRTDRNGRFTFPKQLPKGQAYGLVVVARGYKDMAIESALRISPQAPEKAQIYPIPMMAG